MSPTYEQTAKGPDPLLPTSQSMFRKKNHRDMGPHTTEFSYSGAGTPRRGASCTAAPPIPAASSQSRTPGLHLLPAITHPCRNAVGIYYTDSSESKRLNCKLQSIAPIPKGRVHHLAGATRGILNYLPAINPPLRSLPSQLGTMCNVCLGVTLVGIRNN